MRTLDAHTVKPISQLVVATPISTVMSGLENEPALSNSDHFVNLRTTARTKSKANPPSRNAVVSGWITIRPTTVRESNRLRENEGARIDSIYIQRKRGTSDREREEGCSATS